MNENDEKFDWRDLATQAPGKAGADEWGDGAQERSAWNKAMGWIILVSMTIAGVLIIWASSCNGFLCELLPVLLLMIDFFATIYYNRTRAPGASGGCALYTYSSRAAKRSRRSAPQKERKEMRSYWCGQGDLNPRPLD